MATKTLLTVEQFEQLPDDGMRHELDEGELISMPPPLGLAVTLALVGHGQAFSRTTAAGQEGCRTQQ